MLNIHPSNSSADLSQHLQEPADVAAGGAGQVAVVLVNWNGWRHTLAAYESLAKSSFRDWEILCVDNASEDESVAVLSEVRPRFRLIESKANLGFSGGCNLGIEEARRRGAKYVYLLNNDATVDEHTLARLVEASKSVDDACVLGTILRFPSNGTIQFWGGRQSPDGLPLWPAPSEEGLAQSPDLIESEFICGASLFMPMSVFDRIGGFDERFFLNFEETDWCFRARRANYRCLVVKSALVFHEGGLTIGEGPLQTYFMRRNLLLCAERHAPPVRFAALYARQTAGAVLRLLKAILPGTSRASSLDYRAQAMGTFDYSLRRFGDCPSSIRKMAKEFRALSRV
jgi:GT2 family glycosyltransferase